MNKKMSEQVIFYNIEPLENNPLLSKGNVDIFYGGVNPNGTVFPENVVHEMARFLPGIPIVGEWNRYTGDFTKHTEGTVPLGFITENGKIGFKEVKHDNGDTKNYITAEVVLWTGRYEIVASVLEGQKSQSFEIDEKTFDGKWKKLDGKDVFEFSKAYVSALCILGDAYKPAFQKSHFYEEQQELTYEFLYEELKKEYSKGGNKKMLQFKLSHEDLRTRLYRAINPVDDEGYMVYDYSVATVFDDYAVLYNYETGKNYRQYYAKDDSNNTISLGERVEVEFVDVTKEERAKLNYEEAEKATQLNDLTSKLATYETQVTELSEKITASEESIKEYEAKIETAKEEVKTEYEAKIVEINADLEKVKTEFEAVNADIEILNTVKVEYDALQSEIIKATKDNVIQKYEGKVSDEVLETVKTNYEAMSVEEIETKLALDYANASLASITSEKQEENPLVKGVTNYSAKEAQSVKRSEAEELLYKRLKNK